MFRTLDFAVVRQFDFASPLPWGPGPSDRRCSATGRHLIPSWARPARTQVRNRRPLKIIAPTDATQIFAAAPACKPIIWPAELLFALVSWNHRNVDHHSQGAFGATSTLTVPV